MLAIFKRNDSWVLPFNIVFCGLIYFLCHPVKSTPLFVYITWFFALLISSVSFNVILERLALLKEKSHVPQITFFLLSTGLLPVHQIALDFVLASVIQYFILLNLLVNFDKNPSAKQQWSFIFNSSFFICVSCILYPSFVISIPIFIISYTFLFGFSPQKLFFFFLGFIIPVLYWETYHYVFNHPLFIYEAKIIFAQHNESSTLFYSICIILMLWGTYRIFVKLGNRNVKVRQSIQVLFFYFLFVSLGLFVFQRNILVFFVLGIPFATQVISFLLLNPKGGWLIPLVFWVFLLGLLARALPPQILEGFLEFGKQTVS